MEAAATARVRNSVLPVMGRVGVTITVIGLLLPVALLRTELRPSELIPPMTVTDTINLSDALLWLSYGTTRGSSLRILTTLPDLAWYTAAIGGPLLIPLLGQRLRFWTAPIRWSFVAWVAITAAALVGAGLGVIRMTTTRPNGASAIRAVTFAGFLPGIVVAPLGLALCLSVLVLLRRARADQPRENVAAQVREGWWARFATISAVAVTLGATLWVLGFYALPWAMTDACNGIIISFSHFANGACAGVDFGDALAQMRNTGPGVLEFLAQPLPLIFMYGVLLGWVILSVVRSWRRALPPEHLAWMVLWILITGALSTVALGGVRQIRAHGFSLTAASSERWVTGPGAGMSLAGLILIMAGAFGLGCVAWRGTQRSAISTDQAAGRRCGMLICESLAGQMF